MIGRVLQFLFPRRERDKLTDADKLRQALKRGEIVAFRVTADES